MNTFPFNEKGFQELLASLYAMPDEALESQAKALLDDYQNWVALHFSLSSTQLGFLQKLDKRFIEQASVLSHDFLIRRLPIELVKPESSQQKSAEGEGKIIDLDKKSKFSASQDGSFEEQESLTYIISYQANE